MPLQQRATVPIDLLSEAQFTSQVVELARLGGWLRYHTHRSKHSASGFPDEVLVRGPRLIFAELKTEAKTSKPSVKQQEWLDALAVVAEGVRDVLPYADDYIGGHPDPPSVEVYLWRPRDLEDIARILTGRSVA